MGLDPIHWVQNIIILKLTYFVYYKSKKKKLNILTGKFQEFEFNQNKSIRAS